mmetsp:Transcript_119235/g.380078  ORF Transcript_119235/g.380078 Transcript_119235/m.380078 type:complete len:228 (+) Transcript_119235:3591-4274(+)
MGPPGRWGAKGGAKVDGPRGKDLLGASSKASSTRADATPLQMSLPSRKPGLSAANSMELRTLLSSNSDALPEGGLSSSMSLSPMSASSSSSAPPFSALASFHVHSAPQTQRMWLQPSERVVGTRQFGQNCAARPASRRCRSSQVTPRCQPRTLHLKQILAKQHGVRTLGYLLNHPNCAANLLSGSSMHSGTFVLAARLRPCGGLPPRPGGQAQCSRAMNSSAEASAA